MLRKIWRVVRWWELVLAPWIVAGLTFFVVGPRLTDSVTVLVVLTLVATAMIAFAAALNLFEGPVKRRFAKAVIAEAAVVALIAGAGWTIFFRRPPPHSSPVGDRGLAFERVQLSTGAHLAIARLPGDGQRPPVYFLHGGPGRPVTASDVAFFKSLAEKGVEVVLFDQGGVGESDPVPRAKLSLERSVAEIEALREKLGHPRISLVGQSWGARLAVEYAGRHADRVEKIAVTGGAPLDTNQALWKFDNRRTALEKDPALPWMGTIVAALVLSRANPALSESFAPKEDLNGLMAALVPAIMLRSVCAKDKAHAAAPVVGGLDGSQFLMMRSQIENVSAPSLADPPPALVLRPECDFGAWAVARQYRDWLKATVVYIEGAGHAVWPLKANVARDVVAAFLKGEPLPLPTYQGDADPAGEPPSTSAQ